MLLKNMMFIPTNHLRTHRTDIAYEPPKGNVPSITIANIDILDVLDLSIKFC